MKRLAWYVGWAVGPFLVAVAITFGVGMLVAYTTHDQGLTAIVTVLLGMILGSVSMSISILQLGNGRS